MSRTSTPLAAGRRRARRPAVPPVPRLTVPVAVPERAIGPDGEDLHLVRRPARDGRCRCSSPPNDSQTMWRPPSGARRVIITDASAPRPSQRSTATRAATRSRSELRANRKWHRPARSGPRGPARFRSRCAPRRRVRCVQLPRSDGRGSEAAIVGERLRGEQVALRSAADEQQRAAGIGRAAERPGRCARRMRSGTRSPAAERADRARRPRSWAGRPGSRRGPPRGAGRQGSPAGWRAATQTCRSGFGDRIERRRSDRERFVGWRAGNGRLDGKVLLHDDGRRGGEVSPGAVRSLARRAVASDRTTTARSGLSSSTSSAYCPGSPVGDAWRGTIRPRRRIQPSGSSSRLEDLVRHDVLGLCVEQRQHDRNGSGNEQQDSPRGARPAPFRARPDGSARNGRPIFPASQPQVARNRPAHRRIMPAIGPT